MRPSDRCMVGGNSCMDTHRKKTPTHGQIEQLPSPKQVARLSYAPPSRGGTYCVLHDGRRIDDKATVAAIVRTLIPEWNGSVVALRDLALPRIDRRRKSVC
jgi:hypothetical protein